MKKELLEHWITLIKPLFPERAYIRSFDKQVWSIIIDWRLNTNRERSYKRSRLIKIIFPKETIELYNNHSPKERAAFDESIKKYLEQQLQYFNPEHDTPRGNVPPQVEWVITENIILPMETIR